MKRHKNFLLFTVCTLGVFVLFASCSENGSIMPVEPAKATRTINKVAALTLFRNGHVTAIIDKSGVQGTVTAQMDENSDIFEVEFIDENGEVINGEAQPYKLVWNNDAEYTTFERHGDWKFCIYGKKQGETTFELLLENGAGVEYNSPPIPLKVK